ncbi:hypothetical protein [Salinicoccus bachuensis]|uniref:Uncharacterized protein n=1 Tax=Salinicoccus bachuensis TaxID=3136731 RepID=A0ABZ3CI65_9STAP
MSVDVIFVYMFAFLLAIFLYRTTSTGLDYNSIKREANKFENWLNDKDKLVKAPNGEVMRQLLKKVDINDTPIAYTDVLGPRHYRNVAVAPLQSYPTADRQVLKQLLPLIYQGVDAHQYKFHQNFNLMYWIDSVVFFPKCVIGYLGLNNDNVFTRVVNILYWIFTPILLLLRDKVWEILMNLFS